MAKVHGLIREEFLFSNISTKDIARHLYARAFCGKVVIVADQPSSFLPALRKQWLKLTRRVQRERSSLLLSTTRTSKLSEIIARMQNLQFTTKWPPEDIELADVYIATTEQLLQWAPECRTLYVTCPVELEQLYVITAWMPKGGVVVVYRLSTKGADQHEG